MPQFEPSGFAPQLVWLVITFIALFLLMWRVTLPRITSVVAEREVRVSGNLDKAEQLKAEAEGILVAYHKEIADARAAAQAEHARAARRPPR